MMRLLFLCLLLPTATVYSEEPEGSAFDLDDEDMLYSSSKTLALNPLDRMPDSGKTTGEDSDSDQLTMIIIIVAAVVLTLSVVAIVVTYLVRRHMQQQQQQGIYSVPTEQDKKGDV